MPITGIGGVFFRAQDPAKLSAWYREHLGLPIDKYGQWHQESGPTVFAPFAADTDYFPAGKGWMLNLRVQDLDAMLTPLREAGVEVITKAEWDTPETGRFARVHDPEGNAVELWEPPAED